jgi:hypothetical protein
MRVLALYAISFQDSLLPKDLPQPDGSAPGVKFPWISGQGNNDMICYSNMICCTTTADKMVNSSNFLGCVDS